MPPRIPQPPKKNYPATAALLPNHPNSVSGASQRPGPARPYSPEQLAFFSERNAFEERRRKLDRENSYLAIPALAPAAVPVLMELAPYIAAHVARHGAAAVRGAIISGLTGSGVEGVRQVVTSKNHRINDPAAVGATGLKSTVSGAVASVGGRLAGAPGAAAGAFAGSKAAGASNWDAAASGLGAGLAHAFVPNEKSDSFGAAVGRQVFRSALGKVLAKGGSEAKPKPDPQRRREP